MNRRRFVGLMGRQAAAVLVGMPLVHVSGVTAGPVVSGLTGEYGFLSPVVLAAQPEEIIRARIATMTRDYGVRDFQFYDWFADYSTPVAGDHWTDPYFHRLPISRHSLEISIDEVHRQDARVGVRAIRWLGGTRIRRPETRPVEIARRERPMVLASARHGEAEVPDLFCQCRLGTAHGRTLGKTCAAARIRRHPLGHPGPPGR